MMSEYWDELKVLSSNKLKSLKEELFELKNSVFNAVASIPRLIETAFSWIILLILMVIFFGPLIWFLGGLPAELCFLVLLAFFLESPDRKDS